MIKQTAANFAKKEVAPAIAEYYRKKRFPYELIEKMADLGFLGLSFPPEYGGSTTDFLSYLLALEEISTVDVVLANIMHTSISLGGIAFIDLRQRNKSASGCVRWPVAKSLARSV